MEIKSQFEYKGKTYKVTFNDGLPETPTDPKILDGVHTYCFYSDKLVVVGHPDGHYTPPGGAIEKGETFEEAAIREIKEETNMKVLHIECIGYQDVEPPGWDRVARQFRMFAIVEPYGDFVSDPDGDISHIVLIDPKDYKKYIEWGEVGDYLIKRAVGIKIKNDFLTKLQVLKELNLPKEHFVVVSSGALAIRGLRQAKDLDVIVDELLWEKLSKKYEVKLNEWNVENLHINEDIEILNPAQSMYGNSDVVSREVIFQKADEFEGIKFINLEHLKIIKQKLGRQKDLEDIALIENF